MSFVALAEIDLEVSCEKLQLLLEESLLVFGERVQCSRIHHHTTCTSTGITTSGRSSKADACLTGVGVRDCI